MNLIGPVYFKGKYGFLNFQGEWVIEPIFEDLGLFQERMISFAAGGKLGFLNDTGRVIVEPRFDVPRSGCWIVCFREGLAAVSLENAGGYIDKSGELVIPPMFDSLGWDFVAGRAIVSSAHKGFHIIDRLGNEVSRLPVYDIPHFNNWPTNWDCFVCLFAQNEKFFGGALNWRGEVVFPPKYAGLGDFCERVAAFATEEDHRYFGPWGLIRISGEIVAEPSFQSIGPFAEWLAPAGRKKKEYGFINTKGEFVIPPIYHQACSFSEGLACVTVPGAGAGNKGFINSRGEMVISPQFRRQTSFHGGVAAVEFDDKFGYIDKTGRMIWSCQLTDHERSF